MKDDERILFRNCFRFELFQTEDQEALWQQILDIVNKTNLIDYTMDIRKRLQLGDEMPQVSIQ